MSEHFPEEEAGGSGGGGAAGAASTAGSGKAREHPDEMSDPYSGADPSQKQSGGSSGK